MSLSSSGMVNPAITSAPAQAQWLAGYTRPRHEQKVRAHWERNGWQVFLPLVRARRQWSDRLRFLDMPLFPSYVFVRLSGDEQARAVQAPGFLWFVHNRFGPVAVREQELVALRQLLAAGWACDPAPDLEVGEEVEVVCGALRGCRGRLVRKQPGAMALMLSAINATVRVQIPDPDWLAPVRPRPTRPLTVRSAFAGRSL